MKNALIFIYNDWNNISKDTIKNCFNSTGLLSRKFNIEKTNIFDQVLKFSNKEKKYNDLIRDLKIENPINFSEYINFEDNHLDLLCDNIIEKNYDKNNGNTIIIYHMKI